MTESIVDAGVGVLFSAENRADPYPFYRQWREQAPVTRIGDDVLLVTRHADASAALRNPAFGHEDPEDLSDAPPEVLAAELVDDRNRVQRGFLSLNPPDHTRLRRLVSSAFTPKMVERLRPRIEEIAKGLVDDLLEAGSTNLMTAVAQPLPIVVISEMLGVPLADRDRFARWSEAMARALDPSFLLPPEAVAPARLARQEFHAYFRELAAERRREPGDDLLSALVAVSDAGDKLTENELLVTVTLLLVAGHETTTNLIGNGLLALLRNPDQYRALTREPELAERTVEEILRYDSPVQLTARRALAETTIGETPVPADTLAVLLIGAANRDPGAHPDPESFDITREPTRHLAFGQGIHFCLGAPLARLEGRIALQELARRAPDLRLDGDPVWKESVTLRGLTSLPVSVR